MTTEKWNESKAKINRHKGTYLKTIIWKSKRNNDRLLKEQRPNEFADAHSGTSNDIQLLLFLTLYFLENSEA